MDSNAWISNYAYMMADPTYPMGPLVQANGQLTPLGKVFRDTLFWAVQKLNTSDGVTILGIAELAGLVGACFLARSYECGAVIEHSEDSLLICLWCFM